jgi:hypothetical protein
MGGRTVSFSPVTVTLRKPHSHDGRSYVAGEKLIVRPPIAEWLRARGVI